jgi:sugar transferase (PEP-CTERM system associated)
MVTESVLICLILFATALFLLETDAPSALSSQHGYLKIAFVGLVCFFCMYFKDLYDPFIVSDPREVPSRLIQGLGVACLVMAFTYFAIPSSQLCRGFVPIGVSLVGISLITYREMFIAISSSERLVERAMILGSGPLAASLAQHIQARPELGIRLVGYLGEHSDSEEKVPGIQRLGTIDDLHEVVGRVQVNQIIVAMKDQRRKLPITELLRLKTSGVKIQEGDEIYEIMTGRLSVDTVRLSWLIFSAGFRVSKPTLVYKRLFSLALGGIGLLLLLPVMAGIALAIWLDSPGPVIFHQTRIGKDGETFTLFKFRTMYVDADSGGDPIPVQARDARVTRTGHWLRRLRLDEIPQLFNIVLGQMYFVGPRPFVPNQELELANQIPLYTQRWAVKPGATGWAQIHRGYCASLEDNKEKLAYDLFYIKNMSLGLDLLILFKTIKILLLGRGGR